MELKQLPNDGYISDSLPKELFDTLLIEAYECHYNESRITGLVRPNGTQTCPHYNMSDKNTEYLKNFIFLMLIDIWKILLIFKILNV